MVHRADGLFTAAVPGAAVQLRVRARIENLAVLRALVSSLAALEDLDIDAVADLRLALDEACTQLIRTAVPDAHLLISVTPGSRALVVETSVRRRSDTVLAAEGSFSWHVLNSLVDEVHTFDTDEAGDGAAGWGYRLCVNRVSLSR
jgi:serine/threonine-protein kinase RsbW